MSLRAPTRSRRCMVWFGVTAVLVALWHSALLIGRHYSSDFDIICEVSRRIAAGGTLYVDAVDHRGPLMYAPMVLRWLTSSSWDMVFVRCLACECALDALTLALVARVAYEANADNARVDAVVGVACLVAGLSVGLIGVAEAETRVLPGCVLAVLLVARVSRGVSVRWWQWCVVGLFAGYALWTKFPLCGTFVVILVYGISMVGWKAAWRPFLLVLAGVMAMSLLAVCVVMAISDLSAIWHGYVHASGGGYFLGMWEVGLGMLGFGGGTKPVVRFLLWFFGIVVGVFSGVWLLRYIRDWRHGVVFAMVLAPMLGIFLMPFPVYYHGMLVAFFALALAVGDWMAWLSDDRVYAAVVTTLVVGGLLGALCVGLRCAIRSESDGGGEFSEAVRREVGDDTSVCAWYFGELWALMDLGLESPYGTPAPNNSVSSGDDLRDDIAAGRWRWMIVNFGRWSGEPMVVGEKSSVLGQEVVCVVATEDGNALLRFVDVRDGELLHAEPIAWPNPWIPVR